MMKGLFETLVRAMDKNEDTVFVSVIESSGSAPRGKGAHMLANQNGRLYGTIGGGAVEAKALKLSLDVLKGKNTRIENFGFTDEVSGESVCGGNITVRFQHISHSDDKIRRISENILENLKAKKECSLILGPLGQDNDNISLYFPDENTGATAFVFDGNLYYIQPLLRKGRVYIFGGGHIAQALVPLLSKLGFRCVIIEDRAGFCKQELFPGAEETLLLEPGQWKDALNITADDFICVMTRGHKSDIDCECFALSTKARYIGVLGSRRKIQIVNAELKRRGFSGTDISRIVTPIGLDISAETPDEIAVSIAAQLIMVRNKE